MIRGGHFALLWLQFSSAIPELLCDECYCYLEGGNFFKVLGCSPVSIFKFIYFRYSVVKTRGFFVFFCTGSPGRTFNVNFCQYLIVEG